MSRTFRLSRPLDVVEGHYGGNQEWFRRRYDYKTGCGPVALANAYAWLSRQALSPEAMTDLQEQVVKYLRGPVPLPGQFARGAHRFFRSRGLDLKTEELTVFGASLLSRKRLMLFIAQALTADQPPVLLLGPNRPGSGSAGEGVYRKDFSNHWVLITEMTIDGEDAVLKVSSWGSPFDLELGRLLRSKLVVSCLALKLS